MKTMFSIFLFVVLATFLGCAGQTNLQRPSIQEQPLAPGDRLRVSVLYGTNEQFFVGPLVALRADTLFLENTRFLGNYTFPLASSVTKLEVSRGRKSNVGKGAGMGFLVGAALGATLGALLGGGFEGHCALNDDEDGYVGCSEDFALIGGLGFGLLGTLISFVGGAASPEEVWEEVPLEKVRMRSLR